jgi:hypothetical protein
MGRLLQGLLAIVSAETREDSEAGGNRTWRLTGA